MPPNPVSSATQSSDTTAIAQTQEAPKETGKTSQAESASKPQVVDEFAEATSQTMSAVADENTGLNNSAKRLSPCCQQAAQINSPESQAAIQKETQQLQQTVQKEQTAQTSQSQTQNTPSPQTTNSSSQASPGSGNNPTTQTTSSQGNQTAQSQARPQESQPQSRTQTQNQASQQGQANNLSRNSANQTGLSSRSFAGNGPPANPSAETLSKAAQPLSHEELPQNSNTVRDKPQTQQQTQPQSARDAALAKMKAMLSQFPSAKSAMPQVPAQQQKTPTQLTAEAKITVPAEEAASNPVIASKTAVGFSEETALPVAMGAKSALASIPTKPPTLMEALAEKTEEMVATIKNFASDMARKVTGFIETKIQNFAESLESLGGKITNVMTSFQQKMAAVISKITAAVEAVTQKIADFVSQVVNRIQTVLSNVATKISEVVGTIKETVVNFTQAVFSKIASALEPLAKFVSQLSSKVTEGLQKAAEKILSQIQKGVVFIAAGFQKISQFASKTADSLSVLLSKMMKAMTTNPEDADNPLKSQYAGFWARVWRKIRKRKKTSSILADDSDLEMEEEALVNMPVAVVPNLSRQMTAEEREELRRQLFMKELMGKQISTSDQKHIFQI